MPHATSSLRGRAGALAFALLVLAVAWLASRRESTTEAPDASPKSTAGSAYAPQGPSPAQAVPGGGLAAHEGVDGAHTLARHVGKSPSELEERAAREGKREVSSFPDEATADRAVAETLWRRRADVSRWLASGRSGNEDFEARLDWVAGQVWRAGSGRLSAGHTVRVVLSPSRRFPEGFAVLTAYVTLP